MTSPSTNVYGQAITLIATVSVANPLVSNLLNGTLVQFFNNSIPVGGPVALTLVAGVYEARLTTGTLNVGSYSITATYLGTTNFLANTSPAYTLVVTPASVNVTAQNQTKVYGGPLPVLTYAVSGLVNGDTVASVFTGAVATTATSASSVGTYPVTQGSLTTNANYTLTAFTPSNLSVTPASLQVTANNITASLGLAVPPLTYQVQGLVNGDTQAVFAGSLATTFVPGTHVGTYPITRGSLTTTSTNYTLTSFVDASLRVVSRPGMVGYSQFAVGADNGRTDVNVYNADGSGRFSSNAYPGTDNGARIAAADFTGDGVADLVVASGPGRTTSVVILDGVTQKVIFSIQPFEDGFTGGINVSAGDLTGDGIADVITGGGPGGGPRVLVFDGRDLLTPVGGTQTPIANFFAGNPDNRSGIRLAVKDLDGDTKADLVVGAGAGAGNHVTAYLGKTIMAATSTPAAAYEFDPYQDFPGGVFVG